MSLITSVFLPAIVPMLVATAAPANSAPEDWTILVSTKSLKNVLEYPQSKLQPIVKVSVSFEQGAPEYSEEEKALEKAGYIAEHPVLNSMYEDIFYARSQPIGLHRYKELGIRPGTPGVIKISITGGAVRDEEANAAANATARVYLDAVMKKAALKSILVPKDDFDLYLVGLRRFGFNTLRVQPGGFTRASFVFNVLSTPAGRAEVVGYVTR